jgi:hypothetical protein
MSVENDIEFTAGLKADMLNDYNSILNKGFNNYFNFSEFLKK